MAEAEGPTRLLEVCGQRFSRFLHNAKNKHLAWLREVEEQGMRLLDSSFGAEPTLMPKTPSQRRRSRKRQSCCLKEDIKEPNRRRLSRRRSSVKAAASKPSSQRRQSKEQPQGSHPRGEEAAVPDCAVGSAAGVKIELPGPVGKGLAEAQGPVEKVCCQGSLWDANSSSTTCTEHPSPYGSTGTACATNASRSAPIPAARAALEEESEQPLPRTVSPSAPQAAGDGEPAVLQGDPSPRGLEELLLQGSDSKTMAARSKGCRRSGRRSSAGGSRKSRRASLAAKYSLSNKRESMIRRSVSRAILKKAVAQASSSASSRVTCHSSLEDFVEEDATSSTRPGAELDPQGGKAPEDTFASSRSTQAANPSTSPVAAPEQQAGSSKGNCVNPTSKAQNENQGKPHGVKTWENRSGVWTRSYKQAMGALWNGQQAAAHTLSPVDEKQKNSPNQAAPSLSSASKVVRPLKSFLQAVQHNQLLGSPGPSGRGGVIKNFIKRNTPSRPALKGDFVEKERQRLESLRKKQEAEEERRKKVEEEKRRRQAEMKQRREERLRKALQAREQMEEEKKKKRMEQKILQSDEKVHLPPGREEKAPEERSKKKLSKKHREVDAQKLKAPRVEEGELEQPESLQRRREEEVKEKGKRVWELRNLAEQQQVEQGKERDHRQREKCPQPQLEAAAPAEKSRKEESPKVLPQPPGQDKKAKQPESIAGASNPCLKAAKELGALQELREGKKMKQPEALTAASGTWLSKTLQKSISASCSGPSKGTEEPSCPAANENNYGMDLKSDDSTDDESEPRKPVPAWADGSQLNEAIVHQYYHPVDVDQLFGLIPSPKLEDIFGKSKPRYFKRTSSAVWHSPPGTLSSCGPSCYFSS